MIVKIDRSFEKDTDKIKDKIILEKIATCIDSVIKAEQYTSIKNLKKLKGGIFYYRIRIGEYRVGIKIQGTTVFFERFLHRKDIYKFFPH